MEPRYQGTLTDVDTQMYQGEQFNIRVEFEPTKPVECVPSFDKHWSQLGADRIYPTHAHLYQK